MNKTNIIGIILTILGAVFWGISGTCAQYLQVNQHINTEWLLTFRLFTAGSLTVLYQFIRDKKACIAVFKNKYDFIKLLIFGIFGIGLCQYSYFITIIYAGAGIATVIQYVAPIIIILYMFIVHHKKPSIAEIISVILASLGTVIIALHGELSFAQINSKVLFWGLTSAAAVAIYSVQPVALIKKYGTLPIVGWAMVAAGFISLVIWQPLSPKAIIDWHTIFSFFGVIIIGTVFAFNFYLEGVRRIGAVQGSILASTEPLSAAFISWLFLGNVYTISDVVGFTLIISTIFILAFNKRK